MGVIAATYNIYKPHGIFLRNSIGTNFSHLLDFGGNLQTLSEAFYWNADYKNLWETSIETQFDSRQITNTLLRGGPSMTLPGKASISAEISSSERKKFVVQLEGEYNWGFENLNTETKSISLELSYRPSNYLSFSVEPMFETIHNELQFIPEDYFLIAPEEPRYLLSTLDQKTFSASLRVEYNITPDLSLQYWGQPFMSSGKYSEYKIVSDDPSAEKYSDRFHTFTERASLTGTGELYYDGLQTFFVFDDSDILPDYSFMKPDFTTCEFLSNLVLKWEFLPGSSAYLVWSQTREYFAANGKFDMGTLSSNLFKDNKPYNVFLLKLSYRFALR